MSAPRRFKPCPAYKDSGVEWLGQIPAHWEAKRLKFVAPARMSKLETKPDDKLYVGLEDVESWTGAQLASGSGPVLGKPQPHTENRFGVS